MLTTVGNVSTFRQLTFQLKFDFVSIKWNEFWFELVKNNHRKITHSFPLSFSVSFSFSAALLVNRKVFLIFIGNCLSINDSAITSKIILTILIKCSNQSIAIHEYNFTMFCINCFWCVCRPLSCFFMVVHGLSSLYFCFTQHVGVFISFSIRWDLKLWRQSVVIVDVHIKFIKWKLNIDVNCRIRPHTTRTYTQPKPHENWRHHKKKVKKPKPKIFW